MKTLTSTVLALGVAIIPAFSQGAPEKQPEQRPRAEEGARKFNERRQERLDKALGLTDAQKTAIRDIRTKHQAAFEAGRKTAQDAHKAFAEALRKPETAPDELRKLHRAAADATFEQLLAHRAQRQEIRALLTPEQREKAARMEGRMEGMRMVHHDGHPGMGMGMGHHDGLPGMGMGMR
jgi:Spy/CpxP family protein refolding chaperone